MNATSGATRKVGECLCANPRDLAGLLADLLEVLQLQAAEIERLTSHVEQNNRSLLPASQMPECISRLSELHARLTQATTADLAATKTS
jgi:hypothetical protein